MLLFISVQHHVTVYMFLPKCHMIYLLSISLEQASSEPLQTSYFYTSINQSINQSINKLFSHKSIIKGEISPIHKSTLLTVIELLILKSIVVFWVKMFLILIIFSIVFCEN